MNATWLTERETAALQGGHPQNSQRPGSLSYWINPPAGITHPHRVDVILVPRVYVAIGNLPRDGAIHPAVFPTVLGLAPWN